MIVRNVELYNGSHLSSRFAYDHFKDRVLRSGNIIAFRAPMEVEAEFMVDKEDLINNDYIYSDDAINFCIEIPDIDLFGGVCFQRLFNSLVANILASKYVDCNLEVDGDDIKVADEYKTRDGIIMPPGTGKASVSIAKWCNNAVLIHTGINVRAGKRAPAYAYGTNMTDEQCEQFMQDVIEMFYGTIQDVFVATCKVI